MGVLAGEPKPAAPDDEQALLEAEPGAFDGIFQRRVGTALLALVHDACDGLGLDAPDEVETQQNGAAMRFHARFPAPAVDAGCFDAAADHAGFVHVKFRAVEPAKVVDTRGHVLDGPKRL